MVGWPVIVVLGFWEGTSRLLTWVGAEASPMVALTLVLEPPAVVPVPWAVTVALVAKCLLT